MLPIIKSVITSCGDLGQYVNRWWLPGPNAWSGSGSSYKFNTQPRVFMRIWDVAGTLYRDISLLPIHYFVAGTLIQGHQWCHISEKSTSISEICAFIELNENCYFFVWRDDCIQSGPGKGGVNLVTLWLWSLVNLLRTNVARLSHISSAKMVHASHCDN